MYTWSRLMKNWRLNCFFLKDIKISVTEHAKTSFQNRYSKEFVHKTKQKRIEKIIYFRTTIKFSYSLPLTWKIEHEGGSFVS